MPVPEGTVVNLIDTVRMAADLAAARASGVDFIVACVHWGDEYQRRENAAQRSLAAFCAVTEPMWWSGAIRT